MTDPQPARRYRFGAFEADAVTGELRRNGVLVKLAAQPFQVLFMLLDRPAQLVTREEISRQLWPDGTFVDYEHGVNSAVNRIREALGDSASKPRFVVTLARRGYRFVAPVERIALGEDPAPQWGESHASRGAEKQSPGAQTAVPAEPIPARRENKLFGRILATPEELPKASHKVVQTLFVLMQVMYLGFYVGALANLAEIHDLFLPLPKAIHAMTVLVVTAAILIPVRAFVITAALFHAPGAREKVLRLWAFLLVFDVLWSLSPFLLLHHINVGLAFACTTLLVYSPFAQRSLVLMGAGGAPSGVKTPSTSGPLRHD
jgi:DNA-binding winged helix-turn-helix (wHTH) protein